jgi:predicted PolB exonuclease-like 3'-5' exonuclease
MPRSEVRYLVFDTESAADAALVAKLREPTHTGNPNEAVARYRAELMEKYDSDFIPYTFQIPISVAIAKVGANYELIDLVVLDEPEFRPHKITRDFWVGWEKYGQPTLVSFNGRSFDLPLLELAAFRYGIPVARWFNTQLKTYDQPRNRYNTLAHIDLYDLLTNFGASRFTGGLNLAANLLGKPGKMDVQGDMVQDMFEQGKLAEINDYCRCDVLDTYFVFLRSRVLQGQLSLDEEHGLIGDAKEWLIKQSQKISAYQSYLTKWGDWANPW